MLTAMAQRSHYVARYHYAVDLTQDGLARLEMWDVLGCKIADVGCVEEGSTLPPPRIDADLAHASLLVHPKAMTSLLDVLRHGAGVFMRVDNTAPGYVTFETSGELSISASQPREQ